MEIKKGFVSILPFILLGNILHAQFDLPKYDIIQDIKNRQPVVIVNPPNPDIIDKYDRKSKPQVVQVYEQIIGNYNDAMKDAVSKFWTFNSKEVLYKTRTELKEMLSDKSRRDKYFIIYCFDFETGPTRDFDWKIDKNAEKVVGTLTSFAIGFPDKMPFYRIAVPDLIPSSKYLAFYISTANFNFNYVLKHRDNSEVKQMVDDNAPILAGKTLLIEKDYVSPKVMNDIGTYYPCNYKLVDDSDIETAAMSGDANYAYIIKSGYEKQIFLIVNCADGATVGYSKKGTETVGFTTDQGLRKDFFQDIADFCGAGKKK